MALNKIFLLSMVVVVLLAMISNQINAESLKEQIENRLKAALDNEMKSNVGESEEEELNDNDTADVDINDSSTGSNENTLIQLKTEHKMSFDCWTHTKPEGCESQYCVWKDGTCQISPASYYEDCSFYCDVGPCVQPPAGTPPGTPCPVKSSAIAGLCAAIQSQANCGLQYNLCVWNNNACGDAPSCCSLASHYCATKKKGLLQKALKLCGSAVTQKTLCSYVKTSC